MATEKTTPALVLSMRRSRPRDSLQQRLQEPSCAEKLSQLSDRVVLTLCAMADEAGPEGFDAVFNGVRRWAEVARRQFDNPPLTQPPRSVKRLRVVWSAR